MNDSDRYVPRVHTDAIMFREAVGFTAAKTGFSPRLIEKDYFCTVLLAYLASVKGPPPALGQHSESLLEELGYARS